MSDHSAESSPLARATVAAGSQATEAFSALANETRLAILFALWDAYEPRSDNNGVSFSDLRERVGTRDSGQFNYHLEKLIGRFVRSTDGGYELTRPGRVLIQSIIAGVGITDPELEVTPVDGTCPYCGGQTAVTYGDHNVYYLCTECPGDAVDDSIPEGTIFAWTLEPTGLEGRTAEEIFTASSVKTYTRIALRFEGLCPMCSGQVEWEIDVCDAHEPGSDGICSECNRRMEIVAAEACTVCKSNGWGTPAIKTLFHPAVVSFFHERGIEIGFTGSTTFDDVIATFDLYRDVEQTVTSRDPLRITVTYTYDEDQISLVLDESMNVIGITEPR